MWILTLWSNRCKYFYVLSKKYSLFIITSRVGVRLFLCKLLSSNLWTEIIHIRQTRLQTFIHPLFTHPFNEYFWGMARLPITLLMPRIKKWTWQTSFCPHGIYDPSSIIISLIIYNYIDSSPFWILPAFIFCFIQLSILISGREVECKDGKLGVSDQMESVTVDQALVICLMQKKNWMFNVI